MKRREFIAATAALLVSPRHLRAQGHVVILAFSPTLSRRRPFRTRGLTACETMAGSMDET